MNKARNNSIHPLREYSGLDRATRLLGSDVKVEIDDFIHWGETYRIPLYLRLHGEQAEILKQECWTNEDKERLKSSPSEKYTFDEFSYVINVDSYGGDDDRFVLSAFGLWALQSYRIRHAKKPGENPNYMRQYENLYRLDKNGKPFWIQTMIEMLPTVDDLFIMREDLALIQNHIANGTPMPVIGSIQQHEDTIHPVSQHFASIRNTVVEAILHAQTLRPKQCAQSVAYWAKQVIALEEQLFESGKCPVKERTVAQYIYQFRQSLTK